MIYCRSRELRAKTLESYEHTLRLFERWCNDELNITQVDQVTESVIRRYITNLQERGKYTFYANEKSKEQNFPERRRDFRKPVSAATINNYIRNLKVFFNWLDSDYVLKKNPMKKVRQLKTNRNAKEYISDVPDVEPWDCVTLDDIQNISTYGSNWQNIFESCLADPLTQKGDKKARTQWLSTLHVLSKRNRSTYSITKAEYEWIKNMYDSIIATELLAVN